jgi:energy-coupling factor transport system permease protein
MCTNSIFILAIMVVLGILTEIYFFGFIHLLKSIRYLIIMFGLVIVFNLIVNQKGDIILFANKSIVSFQVTLQSLLYGISNGLMLISVLLWFQIFNVYVTNEKLLYIMRGFSPKLSRSIILILNTLPEMKKRIRIISEVNGGDEQRGRKNKIAKALNNLTILMEWSIESTVQKTDSMRTRGYEREEKTVYRLYKFTGMDWIYMLLILVLVIGMVVSTVIINMNTGFIPDIRYAGLKLNGVFLIFVTVYSILPFSIIK